RPAPGCGRTGTQTTPARDVGVVTGAETAPGAVVHAGTTDRRAPRLRGPSPPGVLAVPAAQAVQAARHRRDRALRGARPARRACERQEERTRAGPDRKRPRLNSSHVKI